MKFNWGVAIVIFYSSFVSILLYFVIQSGKFNHSLVVENYYEEDLNYESHFDEVENGNELADEVMINYSSKEQIIDVKFSDQRKIDAGFVSFYRPSNGKLDFKQKITLSEENEMKTPVAKISSGRWIVSLNWKEGEKGFYRKNEIFIE